MDLIIDRRPNSRNKSIVNRQRFLGRYKKHIQDAVKGMIAERDIKEIARGGEVRIPTKDLQEPAFRHKKRSGEQEFVVPGNKEFVPGDRIQRERDGSDGQGSDGGQGESVDEFLNIFFDDLELPHLLRSALGATNQKKMVRSGYATQGTASNLAVLRTMKMALMRRRATEGSRKLHIAQLEEAIEASDDAKDIKRMRDEIFLLQKKKTPFIDEGDVRYRHRVVQHMPIAKAVMFCLMDVSASMDETKKDLAKRFFMLLYLFLMQKYEQVEIVFIRHTDDAEEVDEKTFFYDQKSGGTAVFPALKLSKMIIEARYPSSEWNVYMSQASDGDAFGADPGKSARFLSDELLPVTRYFAYIELPDQMRKRSPLWVEYEPIARGNASFVMRQAIKPNQIYPLFRELFKKEKTT